MKNIIIALILSVGTINFIHYVNIVYAQTESNHAYVTDLDLALRLSKDTKQNVVLIFSASWCGFCKTLKKDLPTIKEFDNKIICILDTDEEPKLAKKFKIKSLPTSIILNSDGEELTRMMGYEKVPYSNWLKTK